MVEVPSVLRTQSELSLVVRSGGLEGGLNAEGGGCFDPCFVRDSDLCHRRRRMTSLPFGFVLLFFSGNSGRSRVLGRWG